LTLVLKRRADCGISRLASAGLDTVAIRVPDHPTAQALLREVERPIAAPSANRSGTLSPTMADHVVAGLGGRIDLVLDGGPCPVGLESTIVDLSVAPPALLRPGGLAVADIEREAGTLAIPDASGTVKSPGRLERHYAPAHPIHLGATAAKDDEALIAFGPEVPSGARATFNLSPGGDLVEAAANLFAMLHAADRAEVTAIAVMAIPERGLGLAINDRLQRAAAAGGDP
jgi:L-threonylcarbamoyladenylate synthase